MGKVRPGVVVGVVSIALVVVVFALFAAGRALAAHEFTVTKAESVDLASGSQSGDAPTQALVRVHVSGSVSAPGVYDLEKGSRVADAVEAAGGFAEDACEDGLNLARVVNDGEQIIVPAIGEPGASAGAALPSALEKPAGKVNINRADVAELMTLEGVGESTAKKIVADREANGPFSAVEDLKRVSGIGDKKFESLRESICVG